MAAFHFLRHPRSLPPGVHSCFTHIEASSREAARSKLLANCYPKCPSEEWVDMADLSAIGGFVTCFACQLTWAAYVANKVQQAEKENT